MTSNVTQYSRQTRECEDQLGSKDGKFVLFVSAITFIANFYIISYVDA
jgi:hypothetical protein